VDLNNLNIEKAKAILQQELAKALIEQRIRNQALRELGTIDRLATVKEAYEILRFHRKAVNCSLRYFTKMVADRKLNLKIHEAFHPKNPKQPLYLIEFTEPADLELLIRIRNKNAKNKEIKRVYIRMPKSLFSDIKSIAVEQNMTVSDILIQAADMLIQNRRQK